MNHYKTILPGTAPDEAIIDFFGGFPEDGSLLFKNTAIARMTAVLCAKELGIEKQPEIGFFKRCPPQEANYADRQRVKAFHRWPDNHIYFNVECFKNARDVAELTAHEMKHCHQHVEKWKYASFEPYAEFDADFYAECFMEFYLPKKKAVYN